MGRRKAVACEYDVYCSNKLQAHCVARKMSGANVQQIARNLRPMALEPVRCMLRRAGPSRFIDEYFFCGVSSTFLDQEQDGR